MYCSNYWFPAIPVYSISVHVLWLVLYPGIRILCSNVLCTIVIRNNRFPALLYSTCTLAGTIPGYTYVLYFVYCSVLIIDFLAYWYLYFGWYLPWPHSGLSDFLVASMSIVQERNSWAAGLGGSFRLFCNNYDLPTRLFSHKKCAKCRVSVSNHWFGAG